MVYWFVLKFPSSSESSSPADAASTYQDVSSPGLIKICSGLKENKQSCEIESENIPKNTCDNSSLQTVPQSTKSGSDCCVSQSKDSSSSSSLSQSATRFHSSQSISSKESTKLNLKTTNCQSMTDHISVSNDSRDSCKKGLSRDDDKNVSVDNCHLISTLDPSHHWQQAAIMIEDAKNKTVTAGQNLSIDCRMCHSAFSFSLQ